MGLSPSVHTLIQAFVCLKGNKRSQLAHIISVKALETLCWNTRIMSDALSASGKESAEQVFGPSASASLRLGTHSASPFLPIPQKRKEVINLTIKKKIPSYEAHKRLSYIFRRSYADVAEARTASQRPLEPTQPHTVVPWDSTRPFGGGSRCCPIVGGATGASLTGPQNQSHFEARDHSASSSRSSSERTVEVDPKTLVS